MIIRKIVMALIAAAAIATASSVFVVGAAFALYALVQPMLGRAGAAAAVCLGAAVLIGLVGLIVMAQTRPLRRKPTAAATGGILDQLLELARERPLVGAGALIAAAALAARNPAALAGLLKAFMARRPAAKR